METTWLPVVVTGNPPLPRGGHTASVVDNKLFIFGGSAYKNNTSGNKERPEGGNPLTLVQDDLHIFDLGGGQWVRAKTKGSLPSPRYAHSAVVVGKKIVTFSHSNFM
jgi:hypothetical protein